MRRSLLFTIALGAAAMPSAASALTVVVYADPMTLERRTVVLASNGPDRAFFCMLPPAVSGCHAIPVRRTR